jgi:hypothetical protein
MADTTEPWLVTYAAPFLGVLLVTVGIAGGVMGGYSVVQTELDLCGDPSIEVASEERTAQYTGTDGPTLARLSVAELSPAERDAFRRALADPTRVPRRRARQLRGRRAVRVPRVGEPLRRRPAAVVPARRRVHPAGRRRRVDPAVVPPAGRLRGRRNGASLIRKRTPLTTL